MAAYSGSYLIVTLFILLPVQCTDKVFISKVVNALTKLLQFYKDNLKQSNLDGFFGLRVIEGQLSVIIELYNKGKFKDVNSSFLRSLQFLFEEAGKIVKATPSIWNQEPNYFGLHKTLLERPWKIYHSPQLINSALRWDDPPDWSHYQVEAEPTSVENCLQEIVMKNYRQICSLSQSCMDLMLASKKHGSFLTHQILYVILTEEYNCLTPILNYLKIKNRATDTDHLLLEFCTNSYFDLVGIEKVIDNREELQDLFMEIEFICGHLGFVEFMKMGYLEKILSWQKPSGCFANHLDDNFYRNSRKNEKVIDNYLNPQQVAAKINQIPVVSDKENSLNIKKPEAPNPIPPRFQNFKFDSQNNVLPFQEKAQNPFFYDANPAVVKQQNYQNIQAFDRQVLPNQQQNLNIPLVARQQIHGDGNNFQQNWNNQWNNMAAQAAVGQNQNFNWQAQNIEKMGNYHDNLNIGQVDKKYDAQNYQQKNIDVNNFQPIKRQDNINQYKFNQPVEMNNNNNFYQAKDTFDKILPADNQFGYVANDFARQNLEDVKFQPMLKDLRPNNFVLQPNNQWNQGKEFVNFQGNQFQPRAAFDQFQQNINDPQKWLVDKNSYKKDSNQANGYVNRKLLEGINYDGCLNHKTAMAAGALTAYLRFLLDPGSENIQQMRIDTPNSDLNLHEPKVDVYKIQPKEVMSDLDLDQGMGEGIPQPGDNIPQHFEHEKNIQKPQNVETQKPKVIDGQDLRNFANELVREPINLQVGAQQDLRDFANKQVKFQPTKKWPKKLESRIKKSNDNVNYDFHDQPEKNDKKFDDHEYHMDKIKVKTERYHSDNIMLASPKDLDSSVQRSFIIICVITGVCLYILFRFIKVRRLAFRYKFSHKV